MFALRALKPGKASQYAGFQGCRDHGKTLAMFHSEDHPSLPPALPEKPVPLPKM
jgi:hypothetical protein